MNDVAANTGDTTVHYACGSGTLSLRNRLNAAKDAKSDGSKGDHSRLRCSVKGETVFLHLYDKKAK